MAGRGQDTEIGAPGAAEPGPDSPIQGRSTRGNPTVARTLARAGWCVKRTRVDRGHLALRGRQTNPHGPRARRCPGQCAMTEPSREAERRAGSVGRDPIAGGARVSMGGPRGSPGRDPRVGARGAWDWARTSAATCWSTSTRWCGQGCGTGRSLSVEGLAGDQDVPKITVLLAERGYPPDTIDLNFYGCPVRC